LAALLAAIPTIFLEKLGTFALVEHEPPCRRLFALPGAAHDCIAGIPQFLAS
jgi:hypothetical protein